MKSKSPYVRAAALLLACAAGLHTIAQAQTVTNVVSDTTFEPAITDDQGTILTPDGWPRWPWTYSYAGGGLTDPYGDKVADTAWGIPEGNPTNTVSKFTFDTSLYTPVPAGAWYGFGYGAGMNWNSF